MRKVFVFSIVLCLSLSVIFTKMTIETAHASTQGGPVNVGYLLDEDFSFLSSGYAPNKITLSGWNVDKTGGSLSYGYNSWFKVTDSSSALQVTMKKEFVSQSSGEITLLFRFKMPNKMDGVSWQLLSDTTIGSEIITSGGNLCYSNSSGTPVTLQSYNANQEYGIKVVANIATDTADIYVDGIRKATGAAFRNAVANLNYVAINTGAVATGDIYLPTVKIYKGYLINERFLATSVGNSPEDWSLNIPGGTESVQSWNCATLPDIFSFKMNDTSTSAKVSMQKYFSAQSVKTVYEYKFLLPVKTDNMYWSISSGGVTGVKIITSGGNLCYVNRGGTNVSLQSYNANLWYHIKAVINLDTDTSDIYINGKLKVAGVTNIGVVTNLDNVIVATPTVETGVMWLDDIQVYPFQADPTDYVPTPVSGDDSSYTVGIQSCSMWRDGHHLGWDWVNPYVERKPILGFYDEGSREVADWEIKWMVEHGIDYEMFCWFRPIGNSGLPIKDSYLNFALHDGYFNAKYSDQLKFAITWENGGYGCSNSSDFRNNVIPYWMEYYLKDSRYMVIDNKPVIAIYNLPGLVRDFGSIANAKLETDYLRQACVNAGFSGAILLTSYTGTSSTELANRKAAGFDYVFSYNWNEDSLRTDYQQSQMTTQRDADEIDMIPTLSMGRDDGPSGGYVLGYTTPASYKTLAQWTKDTFMPSLPSDKLGRTMVILDNWNEYGEGHFLAPSETAGFGYLDGIRDVFGSTNAHTDASPTTAQKNRTNILYPTDRVIERAGINLVKQPGFENGINRCGSWQVNMEISDTEYHDGLKSLKGTKTNNYGSVNFQVPLKNLRTYYVSAWAKLPTGATAGQKLRFYLQYTVGGTQYSRLVATSASLSTTAWTRVTGTYTINETGDITSTSAYVFTDSPAVSEVFYLDDIEVSLVENLIMDDPSYEGTKTAYATWGATAQLVTAEHRTGNQSLYINKSEFYGCVQVPLRLEKQRPYTFSVWAKLPAGATVGQKASIVVEYYIGTTRYQYVAAGGTVINSSGWTQVTGSYTINETADITKTRINIYTSANPNVKESFYIDDIDVR